jgi:hypothetical protein
VVVVLFGGSLFPTAGFGSYPTGLGDGNGLSDATAGPPGTAVGDGTTPSPAAPTETAGTADDGGETATPTPPATPTATETPGPDGRSGDGDGLAGALTGLFFLLGTPAVGLLLFAFGPRLDEGRTFAGLPVGRFQTNLRSLLAAVPRRTTSFVVGLSASLPTLLDRVGTVTVDGVSAAGVLAGGLLRGGGRTLAVLGSGLGTVATSLPRAFGGGFSALFGGLRRAGSGGLSRRRRASASDDDAATATATDDATDDEPTPRTVEEAWALMADCVPVGNRRAATPGEYARAAVAAGFPETAVRRLTRAFERVRYGGASGRDELPGVRDAFDRIRAFLDGGDDA